MNLQFTVYDLKLKAQDTRNEVLEAVLYGQGFTALNIDLNVLYGIYDAGFRICHASNCFYSFLNHFWRDIQVRDKTNLCR